MNPKLKKGDSAGWPSNRRRQVPLPFLKTDTDSDACVATDSATDPDGDPDADADSEDEDEDARGTDSDSEDQENLRDTSVTRSTRTRQNIRALRILTFPRTRVFRAFTAPTSKSCLRSHFLLVNRMAGGEDRDTKASTENGRVFSDGEGPETDDTEMFIFRSRTICLFPVLLMSLALEVGPGNAQETESDRWRKHLVHSGSQSLTAVAADFNGDGLLDIISNSGLRTRFFVAPDWTPITIGGTADFIHSEVMDVDDDGDPDYIGARYTPGLIQWLECPADPESERWPVHLVDNQINGTHGIIKGDVDGDGKPDLLAGSAQSAGAFPQSLVWYRIPENPRSAERWERYVFSDRDAPGLSHYLGHGDVDGDGRADAASAAKGGPEAPRGTGDWFAWWQAPKDPTGVWTKHLISDQQPGATNIHPTDVNGDGRVDFIASRGHGQGVIWFEAPD